MRKNVVKAMSVGLSAITIASTLSVPVLADELDPQQTSANAGQATPAPEQAAPAAEQQVPTTPVTNYIVEVANEIAPNNSNTTPATTDVPVAGADTSEGSSQESSNYSSGAATVEEIPAAEPAENNSVAPTQSEVDKHLQGSSDSLYELAGEEKAGAEETPVVANNNEETPKTEESLGTKQVEEANANAEKANAKANQSEDKASQSANSADIAATKALNTATQEDIDAAKTALDTAKTDLKQAQEDAKAAEDAVQDASDKLNEVLSENGLMYVDEKTEEIGYVKASNLDDLLVIIRGKKNGEEITEDEWGSLAGPAKTAILEAYNALVSAQKDLKAAEKNANDAQADVTAIEGSYEYKIAVQKDIIDGKATDDKKADAEKEIAKLSFESHYKANVDSIDIKTDADGKSYYVVNYICKDENGNDIKNEDGSYKTEPKNIRIVVSDEGVSLSEVTVTVVPAHYENAEGKPIVAEGNTIIVSADDSMYAIDKTAGKKLDENEVPEGANRETTYSYEKYIVRYEQQEGEEAKSEHTKSGFETMENNVKRFVAKGEKVTIYCYDEKNGILIKEYHVTGEEKNLQSVLPGKGCRFFVVGHKAVTSVPVYSESEAIIETVTATYTDIKTEEETFSSNKKINQKDYEKKVAEYKQSYPEEKGYVVTVEQYNKNKKSYKVTIKQTKTKTVTTQKAYAAEQLTYVESTIVYTDSTPEQIISSNGIGQAKTDYTNATGAKKAADEDVENAKNKVADIRGTEATEEAEEVPGVIGKVIDAVKKVLELKAVSENDNSQLAVIEGVVNSASAKYDAAVAKKAANDAAANAGTTLSLIISGEPVKYPSVTTATTVEEADETVIPDDAVPAAGQTRTTRTRRTAANNAVAEEETTTIDEAETPLAGGDADDAVVEDTEDTTTVEEDLVPLAGEAQKGFFARTWWGWLLLIIAVLTGSTAYAKKKADAKKVK
ncbi:hypothetical protein SAMN02910377_00064 [Pseudobutyrivibrio ruminis]|uniref:Uncharacterized protein n=1 Tax=Pseudobutyrivibrio ruminis TaxID=46206 RepID=A0A1H7EUN9_9FIRM|nr:hypothetical protein [Pseudobutyrivibrio ruminis]SEK17551.1 hypothetical protein SAMN02910377_00064 [Pseudobutyrivibrio ruminis]